MKIINKTITLAGCALALGLTMLTPSRSLAGPGMPTQITTHEQAEALPAGQTVAMTCAKCKTVQIASDKKSFLAWFTPDTEHECSGCGGKIKVGIAPGNQTTRPVTLVHTCSKCGSESAFCCATTAPGKPTEGM